MCNIHTLYTRLQYMLLGKENKFILLGNKHIFLMYKLDYKYIHKRDMNYIFNVEVPVLNRNLTQKKNVYKQ
jgi:hypothetical protein